MYKFIINSLKPFRFWIFVHIMVATLWAIDLSLRPYLLKIMLDKLANLMPQNAFASLLVPASLYIIATFLRVIISRIHDIAWININPPLKRVIGDALMARMMHHSQTLFQNQFAGSLGNKIKDVMSGVPDLIRLIVDKFYSYLLSLMIAIFAFSMVNYQFGVALLVWVIVFIVVSMLFAKRAKELSDQAAEVRSGVVGKMVDILGNIISVRIFTGATYESNNLKKSLDRYVEADRKRDWYFVKMWGVQGTSFAIYQAICLFWLILGFKNGQISAGDFALILSVNLEIIHCLWNLAKDMTTFSDLLGNIAQGLRIALSQIEIQDQINAKPLVLSDGKIVFDNVTFGYKDNKPLFKNKCISINAGQKVGLVGFSGGGKTTFVNLILRLFDVNEGRILIDEQDISTITQNSLHNAIGMIPQDPSLFHRSLLENIRYGRFTASDEEVIEAAKKAHAHEFISKLSESYETLVGERGIKLSGGQRQRIAIARAILKNAPILILDEATSQLDSVTESYIQNALWELMQNKTTIVIAHRLSTLLHMDRILVFEQGKIVEDGSHEELLAKNGLYKTLWNAQVGGFLPAIV